MRYLGIDFGTKRIGLAISDENATLAFPYSVIKNEGDIVFAISEICNKEKIGKIIIGESKDLKGNENPINIKCKELGKQLSEKTKLPVDFEWEFFSSHQAENIAGGKNKMTDASAGAIILQSYLDKEKLKI